MGHTLPTITGQFDTFRSHLSDFRRALRKADQQVFDSLLAEARQHLPAAGYSAHVVPEVMLLFCMLLEESKRLRIQQAKLERVQSELEREIEGLRGEFKLRASKKSTKLLLGKK
jgi:hypothetical protein